MQQIWVKLKTLKMTKDKLHYLFVKLNNDNAFYCFLYCVVSFEAVEYMQCYIALFANISGISTFLVSRAYSASSVRIFLSPSLNY